MMNSEITSKGYISKLLGEHLLYDRTPPECSTKVRQYEILRLTTPLRNFVILYCIAIGAAVVDMGLVVIAFGLYCTRTYRASISIVVHHNSPQNWLDGKCFDGSGWRSQGPKRRITRGNHEASCRFQFGQAPKIHLVHTRGRLLSACAIHGSSSPLSFVFPRRRQSQIVPSNKCSRVNLATNASDGETSKLTIPLRPRIQLFSLLPQRPTTR
jgi:hypothetical protein